MVRTEPAKTFLRPMNRTIRETTGTYVVGQVVQLEYNGPTDPVMRKTCGTIMRWWLHIHPPLDIEAEQGLRF